MVDEETRPAIQRAAADRRYQMTDEAARDFRREQYRAVARVELARMQSRQRAFRGLAADRCDGAESRRAARTTSYQ